MTPGKTIRIVIALGLLSCAARNASAQTNYYWDPANTISSNGSGSGTWDTGTSGNWWVSGSTDSQWTDTAGTAAAVFGGTAGTYTVNVSGNNTTNALTFNTAGYTLSNGTVTMAGPSPTITCNVPATIGSLLAVGTDGLTYAGTSTLTLTQPFTPFSPGPTQDPVQITGGTITALNNVTAAGYSPIQISAGAVFQSAATLNLLSNQQATNGHAEDVTGAGGSGANAGTLQLVGTNNSLANPDIVFAPDHSGNAYDGVLIGSQQDLYNGTIGLTLDLGNRQRCDIVGNTGHNSVAEYYGSGTAPDCQIIANIIGSGGITYYAGPEYGGLYPELVLSGSNSFSGPIEVDRGSIFLDNASALTQSNVVTLSNSDSTYSRLFLFGNSVTISNLQSAGATPAYTGVANGNPHMSAENPTTPVSSAVTLTVNETANTTFAGQLADTLDDGYTPSGGIVPGPFALTTTGGATLTLTNSTNSYTGPTTVGAGILSIGKLANGGIPSSIGASSNDPSKLVLAGGTLQYTGAGDSTDHLFSLDAAGGAIDASGTGPVNWTNPGPIGFGSDPAPSGTRTLTLTGSNTGLNTLAATITDDPAGYPTALYKAGPGTWVLTASNTYTGATTVQQGLLQFNTGSGLTGALLVNGGTAVTNDTFSAASATVQQGLLQMNGGNTLNGLLAINGGTATLNGTLTATTATVQQHGLLQLFGGSSLNNPLSVSAGTLFVNNTAAAGPTQVTSFSSGVTLSASSTLNLQAGTTWNPITIANPLGTPLLSVTGAFAVNSATSLNLASFGSFTVGDDYPLIALTGGSFGGSSGTSGLALTLPSGVVGKLVTTTATVAGSAFTLLDVDITSFGTISWTGKVNDVANNVWNTTNKNWQLVSNGVPTGSPVNYNDGSPVTFDNTGSGGTVSIPSTVQPASVTVNNMSYTFSGSGGIQGSGLLTKSGSGNLTLVTNNGYSGGTLINGGTLSLGNGTTSGDGSITGNVTLDNTITGGAVLQFNRPDTVTFPGSIAGNGSLVQAGPGATILTGSNTYNGSATISGGTLQIGNGGLSGMIPTNNIVNNSALIFDRSDMLTLVNTIAGSGTTYVNGGTLQLGDGSNVGAINGPVVNNATLALALPGSTVTYSGVISGGSGSVVLNTAAAGYQTLVLTGSNGYTGSTNLGNGNLVFGNVANIGSPSGTGSIIVNGGTVEYTGSNGITTQGLTLGTAGATVQIDNASQTLGLLGPLTGSGGLTFNGPGSLTVGSILLGSQPYSKPYLSAPLQINGGTLTALGNVNASNNSPITIAAGAVMQSGATLNLLAYQTPSGHSLDITGAGTLQLVGTASSIANPDIYFGPDQSGNAYDGVSFDFGLTLNLGSSQRYIDGNTGHNSVAKYYSTASAGNSNGNSIDAWMGANIIGSGGITFTAGNAYEGAHLYTELVLSGSDTFSGPVAVNQGAIFLDNPLALSQSNAVTLSNSSTDSLSFSRLFLFGNSVTISNLQSAGSKPAQTGIANGNPFMNADNPATPVTAAVTLTISQTANTTFAGTIADALNDGYDPSSGLKPGPLSVVMAGPATLVLSGSNTFSGGLTVDAGTLVLSGTNTYGGGTDVDGGTLDLASNGAFPDGSALSVGAGGTLVFGSMASSPPVGASPAKLEAVPEPGTLALLAAGIIAAAAWWRRKKS